MYRRYRWLSMLAMLVASLAWAAQAEFNLTRDIHEHFFHQSFNDLPEEIALAREQQKLGIFVMFGLEECPWCTKMKASVMNRAVVQDYYREYFRILYIDINGDNSMVDFDGNEIKEKDFAFKKHRVRATPVFMFFDLEGNQMLRYTGTTKDPREFIWLAEFVVTRAYVKGGFNQYKREKMQKSTYLQ